MRRSPFHSPAPSPTPVVQLAQTVSTNLDARERAEADEPGPLWFLAARQSGGRGRDGRPWQSLEGNLHATLLLTLEEHQRRVPRLSLLAAVALWNAIDDFVSAQPEPDHRPLVKLKWPNDILIDNAKCAGILIEARPAPNGAVALIMGFGVNLAAAPVLPDPPVHHPPTSLAAKGIEITPEAMLRRIDRHLRDAFDRLSQDQEAAWLVEEWSERATPLGHPMSVNTASGPVSGTFHGLDPTGALKLKDEAGHVRTLTHGDVSILEGA